MLEERREIEGPGNSLKNKKDLFIHSPDHCNISNVLSMLHCLANASPFSETKAALEGRKEVLQLKINYAHC